MPQPLKPMDAARQKMREAAVKPVWVKRREAVEAKNDDFFIKARTTDKRFSPVEWTEAPENVNTSDKERPVAGHAPRNAENANNEFQARTELRFVNALKRRLQVAKERSLGVTAQDRKMSGTSNDRFFRAATSQEAIEKRRAGK